MSPFLRHNQLDLTMPPPAKRQRLSTSDAYDNIPGIQEQRRRNELRLKSRFEAIYDKYDRDFTGIGDVIDLNTGQIVVDNGHLRGMRHERDLGVDKIGPKPVVKGTSVTKHRGPRRKNEIKQDLRAENQDEHDELSSPAPQTTAADVEDIPLVLPAEGWAKPEELNDSVPQATPAQPIDIVETAQLMSRIAAQIAPSPQGQIMLDSTSMAFIITEVTRGLQRQQNLNHLIVAPTPATLLTPPASERAGPIKNFSSVWREEEEEEEQSDKEKEGQPEAEERQNAQPRADEAAVTVTRRRFQPAEDSEILRMRKEGLSYSDIAKQLTRHGKSIRKRYSLLESRGYMHANPIVPEMHKSRRTTISLPFTDDNVRQDERSGHIPEKLRRRGRHPLPSTGIATTRSSAESTNTLGGTSYPMPAIKRRSTRLSRNQAENSPSLTPPKHLVIEDSEGVEEPLDAEVDIKSSPRQTLPAQDHINVKTRRRSGRPSNQSTQVLSPTSPETAQGVTSKFKNQAVASFVDSFESQTVNGRVKDTPIVHTSPAIVESHKKQTQFLNGDRRRSQRFSHVEIVVNHSPQQAERQPVLPHDGVTTNTAAKTDLVAQPVVDIAASRQKGRGPGMKRLSDFRPHDEIEAPVRKAGKPKASVTPTLPSSAQRPYTKVPSVVIQDDLGSEDELGF